MMVEADSSTLPIGTCVFPGFAKEQFKGFEAANPEYQEHAFQTQLLELPKHLHERWQGLLQQSLPIDEQTDALVSGFASFAAKVVDFLRFKRVPLPPACRCNLVTTDAGRMLTASEFLKGYGIDNCHLAILLGPEEVFLTMAIDSQDSSPGIGAPSVSRSVTISLNPRQGFLLQLGPKEQLAAIDISHSGHFLVFGE